MTELPRDPTNAKNGVAATSADALNSPKGQYPSGKYPAGQNPAHPGSPTQRDLAEGGSSVGRDTPVRVNSPVQAGRAATPSKAASNSPEAEFHRYPIYSPRFWHGMRPGTWLGLLKSGRFRVHPSRIPLAIGVSFATLVNTVLGTLQSLLYRRKLADGELHGPPVFIVGHWRSGTTLLHELMVRDERLSSPSTFQCFAPHHFLITEWFFRRFASWLLPGKRPMDNMDAGWDRPQEDEFALLTLGLPSPYRRIAFPNNPSVDEEYLDFEGLSEEAVQYWLKSLRSFLGAVSISTGRPLIIKSPTHTGRIAWLAREFPEAKFIHITRDPRELFPSTCRLWRGLDEVQALQKPNHERIESYVVDCLQRMYAAFQSQRDQVESHRLVDVRYEDLVNDPVRALRRIYETLRLSDFDTVQPTIEAWVESEHRGYKPNKHQLPADKEAMIQTAWQDYFERYGY